MLKPLVVTSLLVSSFLSFGACYPSDLPSRILAGVNVVDTQIVRDAISYAQVHENPSVFNHSMRSWLFGAIIAQKNPAYTTVIDKEVHALGSILHDIGIDPNINLAHDEEPDASHGAIGGKAVRGFLANNPQGKLWVPARVKILVDAVTLHLQDSDSTAAVEIRSVRDGQKIDLNGGPSGYVTKAEYDTVVAAYPLGDLKEHLMGQSSMMHGKPSGDHSMSSDPKMANGASMPMGHGHGM